MDNIYSKTYGVEQWDKKINDCSSLLINYQNKQHNEYNNVLVNSKSMVEKSIPFLLLNYFITMCFEESCIRLAKELGIIKSNKDALDFITLYKIKERSKIKKLIKLGEISMAIEQINEIFGIEILEKTTNTVNDNNNNNEEEDLHFKLLLLNLIEMIRKNNNNTNSNNNEFILKLIEYAQNKLAIKASTNPEYMKELELVLTLLLFPMNSKNNLKLPGFLNDYYSLSLRSKLAELVNRKLLKFIHPSIIKRDESLLRFPDLLTSNHNNFFDNQSASGKLPVNDLLKPDLEIKFDSFLQSNKLSENIDPPISSLNSSAKSDNNYWVETVQLLNNSGSKTAKSDSNSLNDSNLSEFKYDAKLIQLMKLWAWCENQLHQNDIGVPRVQSG